MNSTLDRIRLLFKESGKTQTEIGSLIYKTPQYVWQLLNLNDVNPSKSTIKDICHAFNVREEWLLYGEGPMEYPPEDETAAYVDELLGKEENPLYDLIKAIMKTYKEVSPQDKEIIKSFAKDLKDNMK